MSHPHPYRSFADINKKSKYWDFTFNNPPIANGDKDHEEFHDYMSGLVTNGDIEWAVWQYEVGASGTPHYQGMVCFHAQKRCREAQKFIIGSSMRPIEPHKLNAAITYCTKEDGMKASSHRIAGPWNVGEAHLPRKNTKSEGGAWSQIREMVMRGATDLELDEKFPMQFHANYNAIQRMRALHYEAQPVSYRPLHVTLVYGESELGKSRYIFENNPRAYKKNCTNKWWDNYSRQDTIVLEDYYGSFTCHELFNILDGYPMHVEVKGSHVDARWTRIFITSNKLPHEWYKNALKNNNIEPHALFRRIHDMIIFYKEDGEIKIKQLDKDATAKYIRDAYEDYLLYAAEDPNMYKDGKVPPRKTLAQKEYEYD